MVSSRHHPLLCLAMSIGSISPKRQGPRCQLRPSKPNLPRAITEDSRILVGPTYLAICATCTDVDCTCSSSLTDTDTNTERRSDWPSKRISVDTSSAFQRPWYVRNILPAPVPRPKPSGQGRRLKHAPGCTDQTKAASTNDERNRHWHKMLRRRI